MVITREKSLRFHYQNKQQKKIDKLSHTTKNVVIKEIVKLFNYKLSKDKLL
jgi:hypothetical protein